MERNSFSQRISKIDGNRKFRRFVVVLKLEFEIKNWYIHSKQLPNNLGAIVGSGNCLVVFQNPFFPFHPLYKLTKISPKFRFSLALRVDSAFSLVTLPPISINLLVFYPRSGVLCKSLGEGVQLGQ